MVFVSNGRVFESRGIEVSIVVVNEVSYFHSGMELTETSELSKEKVRTLEKKVAENSSEAKKTLKTNSKKIRLPIFAEISKRQPSKRQGPASDTSHTFPIFRRQRFA